MLTEALHIKKPICCSSNSRMILYLEPCLLYAGVNAGVFPPLLFACLQVRDNIILFLCPLSSGVYWGSIVSCNCKQRINKQLSAASAVFEQFLLLLLDPCCLHCFDNIDAAAEQEEDIDHPRSRVDFEGFIETKRQPTCQPLQKTLSSTVFLYSLSEL